MASFDTSKIVSDIKAGKITSKEPPKYIFVKNPRNNKKTRKLNPRWTAWSKRQKDKKIDKQVDKYVKDRKGPINKDLTKDNSKKKNSNTLKVNKKEDKSKSNGSTTTDTTTNTKTEAPKTEAPKTEAPKKKTNREKFNERFIRTKGGKLARRGTPAAMKAENREKARKKAQAAARLRIKKKKKK